MNLHPCDSGPPPAGASPLRGRRLPGDPIQLIVKVFGEQNCQRESEKKSSPNISAAFKNSCHAIQGDIPSGPNSLLSSKKNEILNMNPQGEESRAHVAFSPHCRIIASVGAMASISPSAQLRPVSWKELRISSVIGILRNFAPLTLGILSIDTKKTTALIEGGVSAVFRTYFEFKNLY